MSDPKHVTSGVIAGQNLQTGHTMIWSVVNGGWSLTIDAADEPAVVSAIQTMRANPDAQRCTIGRVMADRTGDRGGARGNLEVSTQNQYAHIQRADVDDVISVLEKLRKQDRVDPNASDAWVNAMMNPGAVATPDLMQPDPKRTVQINYGVFSATIGHDRAWVSRVASDNPTAWKAEIRFDELDELEGIIRLVRAARDVSK